MVKRYEVISADGHLEVSPADFSPYVAEEHRDRAPRLVRLADGSDGWIVEGSPLVRTFANLTAGGLVGPRAYTNDDGSRATGAGRAAQRLAEQDLDGVDAEVLFPPIFATGALSGVSGDDVYVAIVQGYNSYVAEEFVGAAPDRLVAMAAVPNRGLDMAIAEMRRCRELGFRGVALSQFPAGKPNTSPEDDEFWAAALELGMAVTAHTHMGHRYPTSLSGVPQDAPMMAPVLVSRQALLSPCWNFAQMMVAGVFDRFPALRVYWAETNASWLPMALHQLDENYDVYEHQFVDKLAQAPSDYFRKHALVSFIQDAPVARMLDQLPVENLMWGSDFPHSVGSFPHSREWLEQTFADAPDDTMRQILVDTPARFFGLDSERNLTPTRAVVASH